MADGSIDGLRVEPGTPFRLGSRDPDGTLGWHKRDAKASLDEVVGEIDDLQVRLFAERTSSLLVVLQTMDAGGKDSTIRHVFGPLNAAGVQVTGFKAPVGREIEHDYLWRVHAETPARGEIRVWNRSHYEDVLVVRVKEIVPATRWSKRYRHIREFERMLTDEGTSIVKIHLHISFDEQRARLQDRIDDPTKRWKFRAGDLDDRRLWPQYMDAYEAALNETSTEEAPWWVVPANRTWVRDLAVARIVRAALLDIDPHLPPDEPGLEGLVVV